MLVRFSSGVGLEGKNSVLDMVYGWIRLRGFFGSFVSMRNYIYFIILRIFCVQLCR